MTRPSIASSRLYEARQRLAGRVRETPLYTSSALSELAGCPVSIKAEHHQTGGSFKLRGATNAVLCLDGAAKSRGVVGVSTGNHGRGLAYAARDAGIHCVICMSSLVPANKIEGIRDLGAEIRIRGASQDEAQEEADALVTSEGMTMIPPFDHADVIAGQATLGLEILDQCPNVSTIVVPLSGGGLISGIALAARTAGREIRIIGVSMDRGAAMHASQQAGKPVLVPELASIADSLGGGIGLKNTYTFALVRDLVDDVVLLSEAEIMAGIHHAYWIAGEVVEGAGAVALGAMIAGRIAATGPTVLVTTGKNIDMKLHHRIISGEQVILQ
jgi:threonine dehydratase